MKCKFCEIENGPYHHIEGVGWEINTSTEDAEPFKINTPSGKGMTIQEEIDLNLHHVEYARKEAELAAYREFHLTQSQKLLMRIKKLECENKGFREILKRQQGVEAPKESQ